MSTELSRGQQGGLTKPDAVLSNIRRPAVTRESCRSAYINRKCRQRAERRLSRKHSLLSACYSFCSMCTLLICEHQRTQNILSFGANKAPPKKPLLLFEFHRNTVRHIWSFPEMLYFKIFHDFLSNGSDFQTKFG